MKALSKRISDERVSVRLSPFEALRNAGFPMEHVMAQVRLHLDELGKLSDDASNKKEAIAETESYLAQLQRAQCVASGEAPTDPAEPRVG